MSAHVFAGVRVIHEASHPYLSAFASVAKNAIGRHQLGEVASIPVVVLCFVDADLSPSIPPRPNPEYHRHHGDKERVQTNEVCPQRDSHHRKHNGENDTLNHSSNFHPSVHVRPFKWVGNRPDASNLEIEVRAKAALFRSRAFCRKSFGKGLLQTLGSHRLLRRQPTYEIWPAAE